MPLCSRGVVELCRLCIGWSWIRSLLFLLLVAHLHVPVFEIAHRMISESFSDGSGHSLRAPDHSIRKLSLLLPCPWLLQLALELPCACAVQQIFGSSMHEPYVVLARQNSHLPGPLGAPVPGLCNQYI